MTRMGFFLGAVVLAFVMATANTTTFANSCCGAKKDAKECNKEIAADCAKNVSASESSDNCPVCGQAADSKDQQTDVAHAGETVHLCCEGCANAYNENPDKYTKVEKPKQSHRAAPPKKKKQRGEGYY
jgi:YHS domain-containing protein